MNKYNVLLKLVNMFTKTLKTQLKRNNTLQLVIFNRTKYSQYRY